jgi:hypothetical protein
MSRLDKPTDFSALLEKYADSPPIPRSGWNTDRERSNSEPSRHDMIREQHSNAFDAPTTTALEPMTSASPKSSRSANSENSASFLPTI